MACGRVQVAEGRELGWPFPLRRTRILCVEGLTDFFACFDGAWVELLGAVQQLWGLRLSLACSPVQLRSRQSGTDIGLWASVVFGCSGLSGATRFPAEAKVSLNTFLL